MNRGQLVSGEKLRQIQNREKVCGNVRHTHQLFFATVSILKDPETKGAVAADVGRVMLSFKGEITIHGL